MHMCGSVYMIMYVKFHYEMLLKYFEIREIIFTLKFKIQNQCDEIGNMYATLKIMSYNLEEYYCVPTQERDGNGLNFNNNDNDY